MNRYSFPLFNSMALSLCVLFIAGCTLRATTESLTDTTTNILSSTTPGSWFTADGLLKPEEKIHAFVATNYDNLQQDIAQGEGEYLTALGTLLKIREEKVGSFYARAQENFQHTFVTVDHRPQSVFTMLSSMQGQGHGQTD